MGDTYENRAKEIRRSGRVMDYEAMSLDALARSWELEDRECQALALADAQVWATLHLARQMRGGSAPQQRQPNENLIGHLEESYRGPRFGDDLS